MCTTLCHFNVYVCRIIVTTLFCYIQETFNVCFQGVILIFPGLTCHMIQLYVLLHSLSQYQIYALSILFGKENKNIGGECKHWTGLLEWTGLLLYI